MVIFTLECFKNGTNFSQQQIETVSTKEVIGEITTENKYKIDLMIGVCSDAAAIQITSNLAGGDSIRHIVEKTDGVLIIHRYTWSINIFKMIQTSQITM